MAYKPSSKASANDDFGPTPEQLRNRKLAAGYVLAVVLGITCTAYVTIAATSSSKAPSIPKKAPVAKMLRPAVSPITKQLDAIKLKLPLFDLSASPIPSLKIAPLNLMMPQLPGKGMLKNFGVDKDVAYKGGAVQIEMPEVDVAKYMPTDIPSGPSSIPTGGAPTAAPSGSSPSAPSADVPSTPTQGQVNQANCAQFNGIPSCSYVGDPSGQTLCNQCKAAGF